MKHLVTLGVVLALSLALGQHFTQSDKVDLITDKDASIAGMVTRNWNSYDASEGMVVFRCSGQDVEVFVVLNEILGNTSLASVVYRFDSTSPIQGRWLVASATQAAVFVPQSSLADFIQKLRNHQQLVIRVTAANQRDYTLLFEDITGFSNYFDKLKCLP